MNPIEVIRARINALKEYSGVVSRATLPVSKQEWNILVDYIKEVELSPMTNPVMIDGVVIEES